MRLALATGVAGAAFGEADRTIQRFDDLGQRDRARRTRQLVAARRAPEGVDQIRVRELLQL